MNELAVWCSGGGWRSAVGRRPNIHLDVHLPITSNTASASATRYSNFDITIDRFGQEEDVTGASFAEPIGYLTDRSSRHPSRSLSKQSDPRLSNSLDSQRAAAQGQHAYILGTSDGHR